MLAHSQLQRVNGQEVSWHILKETISHSPNQGERCQHPNLRNRWNANCESNFFVRHLQRHNNQCKTNNRNQAGDNNIRDASAETNFWLNGASNSKSTNEYSRINSESASPVQRCTGEIDPELNASKKHT